MLTAITVALLCISLVANDFGRLFVHWSFVSFLEKCPHRSFSHFLIGLSVSGVEWKVVCTVWTNPSSGDGVRVCSCTLGWFFTFSIVSFEAERVFILTNFSLCFPFVAYGLGIIFKNPLSKPRS